MNKPIRTLGAGLLIAGLVPLARGEVLITDFSDLTLDYTYAQWDFGTFTSGATQFRVEAFDSGGGGKGAAVDGTGCDTLQVTFDVNAANASDAFNVVLSDADGTQRVYRFSGLATGVEDLGVSLTKDLTDFIQDNAPGTTPGLDLANLTGFDLQGTFGNGNPGLLMDLSFDTLELTQSGTGPVSEIPNGDFETPGGDQWSSTTLGGGTFLFDFPAGIAQIDHSADDGGVGLLQANSGTNLPVAGLGLTAGMTYTFSVDMRIESGANIGGLKVDFQSGSLDGGSTGYLFPASGSGSWTTYDFDVTLPPVCTAIQLCLVSGEGSVVQYDNVGFSTTAIPNPTPGEIPNGDFGILGGAGWAENSGGGTFDFSYPASGGNGDGYGVMDNTADGTGFGVLVGNNDAIIPLSGLGLAGGNSYRFSQDMRVFSGTNLGGLKVEFYDGGAAQGSTGDLFPPAGDINAWETYDFDVEIPPCADGIKVVLLWGAASEVGFDNITVDPTPLVLPPGSPVIPNGDFEAAGTNWAYFTDGYFLDYPPSGGVGDSGYAEIDAFLFEGNFGVLVSNDNSSLKLSELGLEPGGTYTVGMDMRIIDGEGTSIGGLKVEYWVAGQLVSDTDNMYPDLIGDGSTWETYEFEITIPECANEIRFVPIWGPGTRVGYDNLVIDVGGGGGDPAPAIVAVSKAGDVFTVVFQSRTGFSYNFLHSPDLATAFTPIQTGLAGTGGELMFSDDSAAADQGYYQVEEVASP